MADETSKEAPAEAPAATPAEAPAQAPASEAAAAIAPAGDAPPEATPKKPNVIKEKLTAVLGKVKSNIPTLPKPDPVALKLAAKDMGMAIVMLPIDIIRGDSLTRVAGIGFLAALGLFALTLPRVLTLWRSPTPPAAVVGHGDKHGDKHGDGGHNSAGHDEAADPEAPTDIRALKSVVYLGLFQQKLEAVGEPQDGDPQAVEIEFFVETSGDPVAATIKNDRDALKPAVSAALQDVTVDELLSNEGKKIIRQRIKEKLNDKLGHGAIKDVFVTKLSTR